MNIELNRIFSVANTKRSPFVTLNVLHILNDGLLASLPLLLPFVQNELNIDYGRIGILTSIIGMAGVVLAMPAAIIGRKMGGFKTLVLAAVFLLPVIHYNRTLTKLYFSCSILFYCQCRIRCFPPD